MRIFYDHQATSLQDAGGLSRYHYELTRELANIEGVSVEYFLGLNASVLPFAALARGPAGNNDRAQGGAVSVVSWSTRTSPGALRYACNALATSIWAPWRGAFDIYHSTYQRREAAVRAQCLVATHHDSTQERFPELFRNARAIRARKGALYRRADAIICVSEASKRDLLRFFDVDEAKTAVIHHGFTPPPPAGDQEMTNSLEHTPSLLYVGARSRYKNFDTLLRAFAHAAAAARFHLQVAGGGPFTPEEAQLLTSLRLEDRVHLHPKVSEGQLAQLYSGASLFVYPSLHEGFGFPPLEAMSRGCPVLVSDVSSLPEVCGNAAFYFDPTAEESLVAQLERLLSSPELRRSKIATGHAQVARFSWKRAALATLALYRHCLAH